MTIFLPHRRRASVRAFLATIAVLAGVVPPLLAPVLGWSRALAADGVVALVVVALLTQETILNRMYGGWNWLLVKGFAPFARAVATRLAYGIVICAGSTQGRSRLALASLDRPDSGWTPRLPQTQVEEREVRSGRVWRRQIAWAFQSGNVWSLALVPLLMILRTCSDTSESAPPIENIYTLF
jgi:hypothetical protein